MIRVGMTSELSLQRNDAINHKNFIPKYLDNALTRRLLEEKASGNDFGRTVPSVEKYCAASKIGNDVGVTKTKTQKRRPKTQDPLD